MDLIRLFMYLESFDVFNGYDITFLSVISFLSVIAGILTVITKNPIFSVLFLIFLFGNISLYLIFVGIVFLGLSYLLVYVGAVSILFLFILMLINIRVSELIENTKNNIPLAIIVILSFFVPINSILPLFYNDIKDYTLLNVYKTKISFVSSNSWDNNILDVSDINSIGNIMYSSHFIWLLITSIILLLAMVGAIIITLKQKQT